MQDRRTPTARQTHEPHARVADAPALAPARPSRRYPSQEDELLRRARALDTATDANVRVLRRLLGKEASR